MPVRCARSDDGSLGVAYLARGADQDCLDKFRRFVESYKSVRSGINHNLFVILKGFASPELLRQARRLFRCLAHTEIHVDDVSFDIGAYSQAVNQITTGSICFLNTNSKIISDNWLLKLAINLNQERVGLVGATGSFESLGATDPRFPPFPNVHIRSNAFLLRRGHAQEILSTFVIRRKEDAYMAESGPDSITRRIFSLGLSVLVVGRNGRGYSPLWWPSSQTFRQGLQRNLLVEDNITRAFDKLTWGEKKHLCDLTWGSTINQIPHTPQNTWQLF